MQDHFEPVLPEHDQNRDQRTDVQQDIKHLHCGRVCLDAEEDAAEQEMPAGGNRKEFSQALDQSEKSALKD